MSPDFAICSFVSVGFTLVPVGLTFVSVGFALAGVLHSSGPISTHVLRFRRCTQKCRSPLAYRLNSSIVHTSGHYSGPVSIRVLRSRRCTQKCKSPLASGLNSSQTIYKNANRHQLFTKSLARAPLKEPQPTPGQPSHQLFTKSLTRTPPKGPQPTPGQASKHHKFLPERIRLHRSPINGRGRRHWRSH